MSYDPTQQVPPPQGYPPPQNFPPPQQPPAYPQPYTQQAYPPQQPPVPQTYPQYATPPGPTSAGFDFNTFWRNLSRTGQVCLIGGIVLFFSLFFNWYTENISCSGPQCTDDLKNFLKIYDRSANGWGIANGGISLSIGSVSGTQTFSFPLLWLVILACIALIVLPILGALGKMPAQQTQLFILIASGLALLIELIYMFAAFSSLSPLKDDITRGNGSASTVAKMATGPDFGFILGLLATLAAGGVYLYFGYIKKPAIAGYAALPYQQVPQYPGSQPYQPPQYPGSQPPQYPGSQPYQPPTQYVQPPQYPQYPGQQPPPPYPGQ